MAFFCVFGASLIYTLEEFSAIFPVLRMRIHLIHKPVLLSMFFYCLVRNLVDKLPQFRQSFRCSFYEIAFDLRHNMFDKVNNQIIKVIEILVKTLQLQVLAHIIKVRYSA